MSTMIFPNLPVSDLEKAKTFYTALGFPLNEQFSDENSASVVVSDEIVIMLLSPAFSAENGLTLPGSNHSVSNALSEVDRAAVDARYEKAMAAGATPRGETIDMGFMYSRGITDPDGHFWDFLWMDPGAARG